MPSKPRGLGDVVEGALKKIGVTKERVEKLTGRKCNCSKRQDTLNKLVPFNKKDPFEPDDS